MAKTADHSLAAHTPTNEYVERKVQQRTLELLGADKAFVNRYRPLPYDSKYPITNKTLDALVALAIDPVTKPLSLRGDLKENPALHRLANVLADKGNLRRYPGGGIGIGGGGGSSGDSAGDATSSSSVGTPSAATTAMGEVMGALGLGPTSAANPTSFSSVTGSPSISSDPSGFGLTATMTGGGSGGGAAPSSDSPGEGPGPGEPEGSKRTSIEDLARTADRAPFSLQRALDAIRGIIGIGPNPSSGTTIGKAAGSFTGLNEGMKAAGLFGPTAGPPGLAMSLPAALARGGAADAASRASTAMKSEGFTPNAVTIDAITKAMTGPSPGTLGDQGPGMFFTGVPLGSGGMTTTPGTGTTVGNALASGGSSAPGVSPAGRANAIARLGGGISPAFLEALQSLRDQQAA